MDNFNELVASLRICANERDCIGCKESANRDKSGIDLDCVGGDSKLANEAADAIEYLMRKLAFRESALTAVTGCLGNSAATSTDVLNTTEDLIT